MKPISAVLAAFTALSLCLSTAGAKEVRIIQTNSRGDNIHIIDPDTHSIVGEITGVPVNHGVAVAPDGQYLYFSSEAKHSLVVVDAETLEVTDEIPLSGRPHNISIGEDGRFVYAGIMEEPGGIDIIDVKKRKRVRTLDTGSLVHNTYVTPDGEYLVASAFLGKRNLRVYDIDTLELAWALYPPRREGPLEGIRPIAFETTPDGSTNRMFVQISDFHGFRVVDFEAQKEVERIELPSVPPEEQAEGPFTHAPAHGIGVAPNGKTLWVCSRLNGYVYAYSLPDLDYLGGVSVGSHPDWLTFTPDSRFVYVANGHSNDVSVVDVQARKEIKRIDVGKAPKRNTTAMLPE